MHRFETFYRIGSYIYGGGQVVLPLIIEQVVRYFDIYVYIHIYTYICIYT
jgi:chromate transport protein ChrA